MNINNNNPWTVQWSNTYQKEYYFNTETNESTWDKQVTLQNPTSTNEITNISDNQSVNSNTIQVHSVTSNIIPEIYNKDTLDTHILSSDTKKDHKKEFEIDSTTEDNYNIKSSPFINDNNSVFQRLWKELNNCESRYISYLEELNTLLQDWDNNELNNQYLPMVSAFLTFHNQFLSSLTDSENFKCPQDFSTHLSQYLSYYNNISSLQSLVSSLNSASPLSSTLPIMDLILYPLYYLGLYDDLIDEILVLLYPSSQLSMQFTKFKQKLKTDFYQHITDISSSFLSSFRKLIHYERKFSFPRHSLCHISRSYIHFGSLKLCITLNDSIEYQILLLNDCILLMKKGLSNYLNIKRILNFDQFFRIFFSAPSFFIIQTSSSTIVLKSSIDTLSTWKMHFINCLNSSSFPFNNVDTPLSNFPIWINPQEMIDLTDKSDSLLSISKPDSKQSINKSNEQWTKGYNEESKDFYYYNNNGEIRYDQPESFVNDRKKESGLSSQSIRISRLKKKSNLSSPTSTNRDSLPSSPSPVFNTPLSSTQTKPSEIYSISTITKNQTIETPNNSSQYPLNRPESALNRPLNQKISNTSPSSIKSIPPRPYSSMSYRSNDSTSSGLWRTTRAEQLKKAFLESKKQEESAKKSGLVDRFNQNDLIPLPLPDISSSKKKLNSSIPVHISQRSPFNTSFTPKTHLGCKKGDGTRFTQHSEPSLNRSRTIFTPKYKKPPPVGSNEDILNYLTAPLKMRVTPWEKDLLFRVQSVPKNLQSPIIYQFKGPLQLTNHYGMCIEIKIDATIQADFMKKRL